MPILSQEPDLFPPDLLTRPELGAERQWWAVYTRSRQEKELMRRLYALEIPFYSPIVESRSRSPAGRIRTSYLPLFSNYVFLLGTEDERLEALKTNTVSSMIEVTDPAKLVRDLAQIRQLIATRAPVTIEARLEPGTPVRIKSGVFKGIEGTILQRHGQSYLAVAVNFLQQGASVRLEDFEVEPLV